MKEHIKTISTIFVFLLIAWGIYSLVVGAIVGSTELTMAEYNTFTSVFLSGVSGEAGIFGVMIFGLVVMAIALLPFAYFMKED